MKSKPATYRVTGVVHVRADSASHAARIAKGVFQMKENCPAKFTVQVVEPIYRQSESVDLDKKMGEPGYH
jgi:hypothetical protein